MVCEELQGKVDASYGKNSDNRQVISLADTLSSKVIAAVLSESYPQYGRLDEEYSPETRLEEEKCWITDPLDGSAAYVRGLDWWAVGLALHERSNVSSGGSGISFGIIITPGRDGPEIFVGGTALGGCWDKNGNPRHVSKVTEPKQMSFSVGSRDVRVPQWITALQVIGLQTSRLFAGIDTQYATTKLLGSMEFLVRAEQPSYDIAPLIGIVEGAGGAATELDGSRVVVQRDLERRHNIFAYNGNLEVFAFFNSIYGSGFDIQVAIPPTSSGRETSEAKLADVIRTGTRYETACLLPKCGDRYLIKLVDRFGNTGNLHWDFGMSKSVSLVEADGFIQHMKNGLAELQDINKSLHENSDLQDSDIPDLSPVVDTTHPGQLALMGQIRWPQGQFPVDYGSDDPDFIRGMVHLDSTETVQPNVYFPQGGVSKETSHIMTIDVPSQEAVPTTDDCRWVTLDELRQLAGEGILTQRLARYLDSPKFDQVWDPQEREETTVLLGSH